MKLCVIGNSHAGMLAQAYRERAPEGMNLTFFARQGRGPEGVRFKGSRMFALHKDLKEALVRMEMPDEVDLADYDGFVLVAMSASVFSMMGMVATHSVFGWESNSDERPLMSEAALVASLRATIDDNIAHSMARKIRRANDRPIFVVPQPFPSETVLEPGGRFPALRDIQERGLGPRVADVLHRAQLEAFSDVSGLRLLEQPPETIAHGFLTREAFTRGAARLNPGGQLPEDDVLHANPAYGRLVLDQIAGLFEPA